jgi:hypothetical protein
LIKIFIYTPIIVIFITKEKRWNIGLL